MKQKARRPVTITLRDDARGLSITTSGTRRLTKIGTVLALATLSTFMRIERRRR